LTQIGYSPEFTAIEIREKYCRELKAIIKHDESSAENLARQYQKVRKRILRMYNDSTEQALSSLEEFAQPGFWNQHLFDNSKSIISILWKIRIVLYIDGFDEDQIMKIGKDPDLKEIEIFQERIYEEGVPSFVYRILAEPLTKHKGLEIGFLNNWLLEMEEGRQEESSKPKLTKKTSGGSGTGGSNTPKESPRKTEPIEPLLNDDPVDPFQNITRSAFLKSSTTSLQRVDSLQRIESIESSGMSAKADDSPNESPNKSTDALEIMPEEVVKEKPKPKLTKEQKERKKLEKARKRAEIEARMAEQEKKLKDDADAIQLQTGTRV